MISRRILRIKTMQCLYAYYKHKGETSLNKFEKDLYFSINKSYDLYHLIILLLVDISNYAEKKIEQAKNKKLPTNEDLNPNTQFINNQVIKQFRINNALLRYIEQNKISWVNYPEFIKEMYVKTCESNFYNQYMETENKLYSDDKAILCNILIDILAQNESFYELLEEQSIYWNDEVEFIIGAVVKTIKSFKTHFDENARLFPLFKNDEDEAFSKRLLRRVALNGEKYQDIIKKYCINWEFDRIAFMDLLIMEIGIAEVLEFPSIPTKVTFNEYIELSKYYSTTKSNMFINGILDKVFKHLKETNQIQKQGRGLIGENE